jgi:hypothetical protein
VAGSPSASLPADRPAPERTGRHRAKATPAEILQAIQRWNDRYGEPPTMADWDPYRARRIGQEWRIERYDDGDWPSIKTVRNHFGRLSSAVALAGLVPRLQGQQRPQPGLEIDRETLLHLAYLRVQREGQATPLVLADAVREVSRARASNQPGDLRMALIDLAAAALAWATATDAAPTRATVRPSAA